jgi:hypothetical protein
MTATEQETCAYIRDMAATLADMAKAADLPVLSYALSIAWLEADLQTKGPPDNPVAFAP